MLLRDTSKLALSAVVSQRGRSLLTALGIAVGIAAVVLLTAIGEGIHRFVLAEFTQFGTNLVGIMPGKTSTVGMSGGVISNVRPLSLDDAEALRRVPHVLGVVPVVQGNAAVKAGKRSRRTMVLGTGPDAPEVWQFRTTTGRYLPPDDPVTARPFAVLGATLRQELFGHDNPLGRYVRIGGDRYRVIGVMEPKGQMLGFDLDDAIYIPASRALDMFNRDSLMEVDVLYSANAEAREIAERLRQILIKRHGTEDFTVITQDEMLDTLGNILNILTLAVGALGGISLLVGGVGILTISTISVQERTHEIGLLRALGAGQRQIMLMFLGEAMTLAALGGIAGLILGTGGAWLLHVAVPALPTHISLQYLLLAELTAAAIGLAAGVMPARKAASLDPVNALRAE